MRVIDDQLIKPRMSVKDVQGRCHHYYGKGLFQGFVAGIVFVGFVSMVITNLGN